MQGRKKLGGLRLSEGNMRRREGGPLVCLGRVMG